MTKPAFAPLADLTPGSGATDTFPPEGLLTLDSAGCIATFSGSAEALFGCSAGEAMGRPFGYLLANDGGASASLNRDLLTGLRAGGETFPLRASVTGFAAGRTTLLLQEMSLPDRTQSPEFIRVSRLPAALSRIAELIVSRQTPSARQEDLLLNICRTLVAKVGYSSASIAPRDVAGHLPADWAEHSAGAAETDLEDRRAAEIAFRENRVCLTNNFSSSEGLQPASVALAAFPIVLRGGTWGTLTLSASAPGHFQGDEIALLEQAAGYVAFAVQNFPPEATAISRALLDHLPGAAFISDATGRPTMWNHAFGRASEQVGPKRPFQFFSSGDLARAQLAIAEASRQGTPASVASLGPGTFTCQRILREPGRPGFLWTGVANADRDETAKALYRLGAIVNSSDDAIIGKTLQGTISNWNPAAEKIFGYTAAEAVGKPASMLFTPELVEQEAEFLARIGRGEQVRHFDTLRVRKDGTRVDVSLSISPVSDQTGSIVGVSTIARDITEQKRAESKFRSSEIRYRRIFDSARDGILVVDAATAQIVDANPAIRVMLGLSYREVLGRVLWETPGFAEAANCRAWFEGLQDDLVCEDLPVATASGHLLNVEFSGTFCLDDNRRTRQLHVRDFTMRRQAEATVQEGERRFHTMVDSIPQLAWIARPDGGISWYNQRWYDYTGTTEEQMKGWGWQSVHDPAVLPHVLENWKRALVDQTPFEMEFPLLGADGRYRQFLNRAMPLRDASGTTELWFGTNTDITAQKETEEALRESEARFATAFRSSPVGLVIVRRSDGVYVDCNDTFERLTGYSREELIGNTTAGLRLVGNDETVSLKSPCDNTEAILRTREGRLRLLLTSVRTVALRGEPHLLSCIIDITDRKKAEQEVLRLNAELEQRVARRTVQLETSIQELDAFSYSVSHDLRAPLRAVNGIAGIVLEDFGPQLPEEGRKYLERIRANGQQMGRLIDDLLAFSRLRRMSVDRHSVDTGKMVDSVLEELTADLPPGQLSIVRGELPPCYGDAALLRQVWINLLSNAVKYSRDRRPAVVEIGCERRGAEDVFFVRDNGAGFDMAYSEKLFGVFQRLHRADEFEGTGVGLAIVQRIVNRHGGRVWAEAQVGLGATFFFTLGVHTG